MMETKVVHIEHRITSLAYGSPFNLIFFYEIKYFGTFMFAFLPFCETVSSVEYFQWKHMFRTSK